MPSLARFDRTAAQDRCSATTQRSAARAADQIAQQPFRIEHP